MYKSLVAPILDRFDSETMEGRARAALRLAEGSALGRWALEKIVAGGRVIDPRLKTSFCGITLENPLMVAAGWDKDARAIRGLWQLGFGCIEAGTVTEKPQAGNQKPRLRMIGNGVALNAMGFPSAGMEVLAQNLMRYQALGIPVGINAGKNKEVPDEQAPEAYAAVIRRLLPFATFFVLNVSSPNTPGLRKLQGKEHLTQLVTAALAAQGEARKPLFVKIAPDLETAGIDEVIDVVLSHKLAGIIASNTTIRPELKAKYGEEWRDKPGGVSGDDPDYRRITCEQIRHIYRTTKGSIAIIGVGGVKNAETALEKISCGANAVQLLTALRGEGPRVAHNILTGLCEWMTQNGVKNLAEVRGAKA